jgi:hypothetical protein
MPLGEDDAARRGCPSRKWFAFCRQANGADRCAFRPQAPGRGLLSSVGVLGPLAIGRGVAQRERSAILPRTEVHSY